MNEYSKSLDRIKKYVLPNENWTSDDFAHYRTVEAALDKQIPKAPIGKYTDYKCPVCGRRVRSGKGSSSRTRDNYCQRCGQALDWED